jgi:hypothetical protein
VSDKRNSNQPEDDTPGYVPWRFRDLFKGLKRKPEANPSKADNAAAQEDPLVRETRHLSGVTRQLVIWTRVIAGIAILAFFASLLQWDAMRGQLTEERNASDDTKKAIEASNRIAKAGEDSAGIAKDTEMRQLRAYLGIELVVPPKMIAGQPAKSIWKMRNTGRTPAYKVTGSAEGEIRPYPPPRPNVYRVSTPIALRETVLNPNREDIISINTDFVLSKEQADAIRDGSKFRYYTWGTVFFFDAFNASHYMNFCAIVGGPSMGESEEVCEHTGAN